MLCPSIDKEHCFVLCMNKKGFLFIFFKNGCYIMMSNMLVEH